MEEEENSGEVDYSEYDDVGDVSGMVNDSANGDYKGAQAASFLHNVVGNRNKDNFLHHQIATEDMLEKLEHFYRGDVMGPDDSGDIVWKEQENKELVTFNEFGVTSLMEVVTKYIDKNTILSSYKEERIYEIMADLGDELVLFILCNYEKIGMDTYFKKTKYRLIITTTLHIIESTYRRALHGNTMEEINQSRVVGQFGGTGNNQGNNPQNPQRKQNFVQRMMNR